MVIMLISPQQNATHSTVSLQALRINAFYRCNENKGIAQLSELQSVCNVINYWMTDDWVTAAFITLNSAFHVYEFMFLWRQLLLAICCTGNKLLESRRCHCARRLRLSHITSGLYGGLLSQINGTPTSSHYESYKSVAVITTIILMGNPTSLKCVLQRHKPFSN